MDDINKLIETAEDMLKTNDDLIILYTDKVKELESKIARLELKCNVLGMFVLSMFIIFAIAIAFS